jgi:hypothetical protein
VARYIVVLLFGIEKIGIAEKPLREIPDCDRGHDTSLTEINHFVVFPVR